jgi:hypothetical protein
MSRAAHHGPAGDGLGADGAPEVEASDPAGPALARRRSSSMATKTPRYDSFAAMRKAREKLSRRFKEMTFAEQKREMERLAKQRAEKRISPKRRSA